MTSKLFFGGIPTDIDVRKLREAFPDLSEGNRMEYSDIETLLDLEHNSARFRTVTNRWRSLMFLEKNVVIGFIKGECFLVLNPSERLILGCGKQATGLRSIRKGRRILRDTDRLRMDPDDAKTLDHTLRIMSAIDHAATIERRRNLGPSETQPLKIAG